MTRSLSDTHAIDEEFYDLSVNLIAPPVEMSWIFPKPFPESILK